MIPPHLPLLQPAPCPILSSSKSQNCQCQCHPLTDRWTTASPCLRGPIKGRGPPLKHIAPHTPSPFASLQLKAPLDEAHGLPAPISTAQPTPATPCQAIASNGFPYAPSNFLAPRGDTPAMEMLARTHSGKPAATSTHRSMVHRFKL
jgi:hypothetical protein